MVVKPSTVSEAYMMGEVEVDSLKAVMDVSFQLLNPGCPSTLRNSFG